MIKVTTNFMLVLFQPSFFSIKDGNVHQGMENLFQLFDDKGKQTIAYGKPTIHVMISNIITKI